MSDFRLAKVLKQFARIDRRRLAAVLVAVAAATPAAWSAPLEQSGTASRAPSLAPHRQAAVNPPPGLSAEPGGPAKLVQTKAILAPRMGTAGINIHGTVTASWGSSGVRFQVDNILNERSGGTSGTLRLDLWATTTLPVYGDTINAYTLGSYTLGQLPGGYEYNNVDSGFVSYAAPPNGCYYLTVALQEYDGSVYHYDDFAVLTTNGYPDGLGNVRFGFGMTCPPLPPKVCVPDANTACLLNNRFQATVSFRDDFSDNLPDTAAFAKPVTGFGNPSFETVFFYFNDPNNIELLLKMFDQGNTNSLGQPTIAVLFGTATPLRIQVTITDMNTGVVRTYTSHFPSMVGETDFTAFVK